MNPRASGDPLPPKITELIAQIKEAPSEYASPIIRAAWEGYGPERLLIETNRLKAERQGQAGETNPVLAQVRAANNLPKYDAPPMLWFGIYRGGLTTISGQTGAGKSTILYRVGINAARGETLWNVPFPRPLNVLYADPENANWIRSNKVDRMGGNDVPNLYFLDGIGMDLSKPQWVSWVIEAIQDLSIDLFIADPRVNLFDTQEESSNSEGAREFKRLLDIIQATGCAMVLADHTGKDASNYMGRGASSRAGMAHVVASLTIKAEQEEVNDDFDISNPRSRSDICRLKIFKDRFYGVDASLYLRMTGNDQFLRVPFEEWLGDVSDGGRQTACLRAKEAVLQFASDAAIGGSTEPIRQRDVATALDLAGHKRNTIYQAMSELEAEGRIVSLALDGRSKGILLKGQAEALGLLAPEET